MEAVDDVADATRSEEVDDADVDAPDATVSDDFNTSDVVDTRTAGLDAVDAADTTRGAPPTLLLLPTVLIRRSWLDEWMCPPQ